MLLRYCAEILASSIPEGKIQAMGGKGKKMKGNQVAILRKETEQGLLSLTFTEQNEFADEKL